MRVTKRDGTSAPLEISKLQKAVTWASKGLDVSQSEIELNAHIQFFDGITTDQIQKALIQSSAGLVDIGKQDYEYAAARLLLLQLYKEVGQSIEYPHLREYIDAGIDCGRLTEELYSFDLDRLNVAIKPERDFKLKYLGMQTLYDRYLIRDGLKVIEMPQHFWMRVAMGISLAENVEDRTTWAIKFYEIMSTLKYIPSTPTLFNSGTNFSQMSSCFVLTTDDSIWEEEEGVPFGRGIFATMTEAALYSKFAGGIGCDFSRIRAAGGHISSTDGTSSGVIPYLRVFNDTAVGVNQCFDASTRVFTLDGYKTIKDIEIGEYVLGWRGDFNQVNEVLEYVQDTDMLEIDVKHSLDPIKVTKGHPFVAIKNAPKGAGSKKILSLLAKGLIDIDWVEADYLQEDDFVAFPIPREVVPVSNFNEEDARMYGIMLGDGCITSNRFECGVTFGDAKSSTREFVLNYLRERDVHFWEARGEGSTSIKWSYKNKATAERGSRGEFVKDDRNSNLPFSREHLYDGKAKRIHPKFALLPPKQTVALLQGLIETDGCISRGKEITFYTSSLQLLEGVRIQLLRLKCPTACNMKEVTDRVIRGEAVKDSICYSVRIPAIKELASIFGVPAVEKFNWLEIDGCIFSRIKSIIDVTKSELVYDIRVDRDKTYTTSSGVVSNGGKRNGSFAPYLADWHGDIERYIDLKKPNGDERLRARELFPYMWVSDLFMERVREKGKWSLFCPNAVPELNETYGDAFKAVYLEAEAAGRYIKQVEAVTLWREAITALVESGAPMLTFKDEHNRRSTGKHVGMVRSSNLCSETSILSDDQNSGVCNLGSINVSECDVTDFGYVIPTAMRMLDNVVTLNFYPTVKARRSNFANRPVGLGLMGWTDLLAQKNIDWESDAHLRFTDYIFEQWSYWAIKGSVDLAAERGAYANYEGSSWSKGILPVDTARSLPDEWMCTKKQDYAQSWELLRTDLAAYGIRNSLCMALAPTATISNLAGTSPCIEPVYKDVFMKDNKSGKFKVVDPTMRHGNPVKTAFNIDQTWLIKAAAVRQRYIDQSQSVNIFKPHSTKGSTISGWYFLAWELGLKGLYYLKNEMKEAVLDEPVLMCSIDNPDCETCQ